jgi:hypothetical protein
MTLSTRTSSLRSRHVSFSPIRVAVTSRIPFSFERDLLYRGRVRPDTSIYPGVSWLSNWRDENFRPTYNRDVPQTWVLNLEGALLSSEALHDLIVPLGQGIRDGLYGPSALFVATSSEALTETLESLAIRHEFPLFLLQSVEMPLTEATPVGPLTGADRAVLDYLTSTGGVATSAQMAKAEGIELPAAGNRLASTHRKSFVARIERPRRQGHQFVDLRIAFAPRHSGTIPAAASVGFDPEHPSQLRQLIETTAREQNREPSEVLAEMWRSYMTSDYDTASTEFRALGEMMQSDDREGLRSYAKGAHPPKDTDAAI